MVINVKARLKVILLKFGTFFGACFKCNQIGHFDKDCSLSKDVLHDENGGVQLSPSIHHATISVACEDELLAIDNDPSKSILSES